MYVQIKIDSTSWELIKSIVIIVFWPYGLKAMGKSLALLTSYIDDAF